jgi:flagellin-like protein
LKTKNKKALSPIFATLIILAVVTVLFIPIFMWTTNTTSQTKESWQASGTAATERIVIEEVNLRVAQTFCTIYVRNIGKTVVKINNVLIIKENGDTFTYEKSKSELVTKNPLGTAPIDSIVQGDLIRIEITNLKGLSIDEDGKIYTIKVFTTRGIGGEYQIVAEQ